MYFPLIQMKLHKAARINSTTPDTKVSRNFTFRVDQGTPPKPKKKRIRRPDIDEEDEDQGTLNVVCQIENSLSSSFPINP